MTNTEQTQPTDGAMRAAKEVWHENQIAFPRERDLLPLAQIIDRETGTAELVAALSDAQQALAHALHVLKDNGSFGTSIALKYAEEKARAVLARHANPAK